MTINLNKVTKVIPAEAAKVDSICATIVLSVVTLAIAGLAVFAMKVDSKKSS